MLNRLSALALVSVAAVAAHAQVFSEDFENISTLSADGWTQQNNSSPIGVTNWFQGDANSAGDSNVTGAHTGSGFIAANFNNGAGTSTISDWLIAPTVTLHNGDTFNFWAFSSGNIGGAADRLQVRLSTNGSSANVGLAATDLGDFTGLLLDINPNYLTSGSGSFSPSWTSYTATVAGLSTPVSGRLALRYFVENGGPAGANSDYIGVDTASYTNASVPEPMTLGLLGCGALALLKKRKGAK